MLHRLALKIRRHGLRKGARTWWHSATRRERGQLIDRLFLESGLLVLWSILLLTWSDGLWGQEGFASTANFGGILLLWLPAFHIVRTRWFRRAFKRVLSRLGKTLSWVCGLQLQPNLKLRVWRPFWFASLGGFLYLAICFRPWGLFPALFLAGCSVMVYLLLHVGGNFGTGIPMRNIEVSQKHHPIGFFAFGFGAMPGALKLLPVAPLLWVLVAPLLWYFGSWTWARVLSSSVYWLAGLGTLIYWILWTGIKWRKYGNLITTNGDVIAVTPKLGLRPGVRIATASISKIATVAGEALLGAYPVYDPGFQFQGGDRYSARWVREEFVEEVNKRRSK